MSESGPRLALYFTEGEGRQYLAGWLAGATTFPVVLAGNQAVLKRIRVAAHHPVAPLFGLLSACLGGAGASAAFIVAHDAAGPPAPVLPRTTARAAAGSEVLPELGPTFARFSDGLLGNVRLRVGLTDSAPFECAVHGLAAAFGVWLLGGRFRALCPSSIMHVGAFADRAKSIPAKRFVHATKNMKEKLHWVGRRQGCHTCGRRGIRRKYIADHQPPSKFAVETPQRFYPQCTPCSGQQGGLASRLATADSELMLFTHGASLRAYHLWLPVSTVVLLLLSDQPDPNDGDGRRPMSGRSSSPQRGGSGRSPSGTGALPAPAAPATSTWELDRRIHTVEAELSGQLDDRRARTRLTDELSYLYLQRRCLQEKEAEEAAR